MRLYCSLYNEKSKWISLSSAKNLQEMLIRKQAKHKQSPVTGCSICCLDRAEAHYTAIQNVAERKSSMQEEEVEDEEERAKKMNFIRSPRNTNLSKDSPIWRFSGYVWQKWICSAAPTEIRLHMVWLWWWWWQWMVVENAMPGNSMKNTHNLLSNTTTHVWVCECMRINYTASILFPFDGFDIWQAFNCSPNPLSLTLMTRFLLLFFAHSFFLLLFFFSVPPHSLFTIGRYFHIQQTNRFVEILPPHLNERISNVAHTHTLDDCYFQDILHIINVHRVRRELWSAKNIMDIVMPVRFPSDHTFLKWKCV